MRHDHLDPGLGDGFDPFGPSDCWTGRCVRAERALTDHGPRAPVVVAKSPGAGRGEGIDECCRVGGRYEDDQLVERLGRGGYERAQLAQSEHVGQCVRDSRVRVIGVRVGYVVRDAGADHPVHEGTLGIVGRHPVDGGEQQRVMGDQ
jgi:hypothetical protein